MNPWIEHAENVYKWLSQTQSTPFYDGAQQLLASEYKQLKKSNDLLSIGRSQGRIEILERILNLRQELENALGQKTTGR